MKLKDLEPLLMKNSKKQTSKRSAMNKTKKEFDSLLKESSSRFKNALEADCES